MTRSALGVTYSCVDRKRDALGVTLQKEMPIGQGWTEGQSKS